MGTHRALIEHAISRECRPTAAIWAAFPESESFLRFTGNVDTITGFEMLEMLQMDVEELLTLGMVVVKKEPENAEG